MAGKLPQKVTLDDLLRLKRTERPSAEFWTRFEEELRAKQLAALVRRRPWWADAGLRLRTALARFGLPLGAATTLALAGLIFRAVQSTGSVTAIASKPGAVVVLGGLSPPAPLASIPALGAGVASVPAPVLTTLPVAPALAELAVSTPVVHQVADVPLTPWTTSISADNAQPVQLGSNPALTTGDLAVNDLTPTVLGSKTSVPDAATTVGPGPTVGSNPAPRPTSDQSVHARLLVALSLRPVPLVSAETRVLEQVSHQIPDELLRTATRHIIGMDGGTVRVRF